MNVNKININQSEPTYYIASDIYDVSYHNSGATFASLSALLSSKNLSTLIPTSVRCGGMSIRFIQSSDNRYVQYRLAAPNWSTNIHDWTSEDPYFVDKIMQEVNKAIDENTPIEIHGNVSNAPDEEDLTSVNVGGTDVLKFKDKAYNPLTYNGMGRKILRKNMVNGVNTLTQSMMQATNTIYVIQYDFTLGENITVPVNCVLEFEGGSIDGVNNTYTLTGNNTIISYNSYNILKGLQVAGTFVNDSVVIDIFNDEDWADKMSKSSFISPNIIMLHKTYICNKKLYIDSKYHNGIINGYGASITCTSADFIEVNRGIQFVDFVGIRVTCTNENPGTAFFINGKSTSSDTQCRHINFFSCQINDFTTGIKAKNWRSSNIAYCRIKCDIGVEYYDKSAECQITNSILFPPDIVTVEESKGIWVHGIETDNKPEGLVCVGNTITYYKYPIYINEIYTMAVTSCFLETTKDYSIFVNPEYTNATDIIVSNCTFVGGIYNNPSSYNVDRLSILDCTGSQTTIVLNKTQQVIISNCSFSHAGEVVFFNATNQSYDIVVSNIVLRGNYVRTWVFNSSPNNITLQNIISWSSTIYGYGGGQNGFVVKNCKGNTDTPIISEIRRVDGVAKYWDGSAWQTM